MVRKGERQSEKTKAATEKNLKAPWEKGQSGNPKGKPAGIKNRSTILRELLALVLKTADGKNAKNPFDPNAKAMTLEAAIDVALINRALKGNIEAIKEIKDSLHGKMTEIQNVVVESFEHTAELTPEELKAELKARGLPTEIFEK